MVEILNTILITYMWNLKYNTDEPVCETEADSQTYRKDWWLPRGRARGGRIDWGLGVGRCKLLYIRWVNSKVLLYSMGNFIQSPGINHNGKEY